MIDMQDKRQKLLKSFLELCPECNTAEVEPLSGDASFRRYFRARQDGKSYVVMDAPPAKEDVRKYLVVSEYLAKYGYSVPEILASDIYNGFLLLEDMGDNLYSTVIARYEGEEQKEKEQDVYEAAIDVLVDWGHKKTTMVNAEDSKFSIYNERMLLEEAELFSTWYLPQILGAEQAEALHEEYMGIWRSILQSARLGYDHLVHRDYHAENLMWLPNRQGVKRVGLLDFQDAVNGDPAYDVVSLLEDARRDVSPELAQHCLLGYLYATKKNKDKFMTSYAVLGAQRNCKIVGIFVRLAVRDKKEQYINMLPRVWRHLENNLKNSELGPLKEWMDKHVSAEFRGSIEITGKPDE